MSLSAVLDIDVETGLLLQARYVPSPNADGRPAGIQPDLIIVHGISLPPGEFGGPWIDQLFSNSLPAGGHPYFKQIEGLKVSSHLLIRRDGEVVQYVPFHRRAWHAGVSNYQGRERCNDFSIGIELEGVDDQPYEAEQYQQLAKVIVSLCKHYPSLSTQRIAGHGDVAPGRKTDPGESFDWVRLHAMISAWQC
ncbi:MAG TPA: 1,6-anhydro-N-acetylmuramyl-L-alanine amidase AmpD [Steroidobacteraceae bacterium]|nr:1,6-anhydro-N-acetylmuramyl-L-alanine amidase AmpD [Steroidobacteraceae bacterium]